MFLSDFLAICRHFSLSTSLNFIKIQVHEQTTNIILLFQAIRASLNLSVFVSKPPSLRQNTHPLWIIFPSSWIFCIANFLISCVPLWTLLHFSYNPDTQAIYFPCHNPHYPSITQNKLDYNFTNTFSYLFKSRQHFVALFNQILYLLLQNIKFHLYEILFKY